ncbi:hypothetical protein D3C78_1800890 [compost metagenome]
MPALAEGSTTRITVCHWVAPNASDPWLRVAGTLNNASSAKEKMIGTNAKPIATPTTSALRWS